MRYDFILNPLGGTAGRDCLPVFKFLFLHGHPP